MHLSMLDVRLKVQHRSKRKVYCATPLIDTARNKRWILVIDRGMFIFANLPPCARFCCRFQRSTSLLWLEQNGWREGRDMLGCYARALLRIDGHFVGCTRPCRTPWRFRRSKIKDSEGHKRLWNEPVWLDRVFCISSLRDQHRSSAIATRVADFISVDVRDSNEHKRTRWHVIVIRLTSILGCKSPRSTPNVLRRHELSLSRKAYATSFGDQRRTSLYDGRCRAMYDKVSGRILIRGLQTLQKRCYWLHRRPLCLRFRYRPPPALSEAEASCIKQHYNQI